MKKKGSIRQLVQRLKTVWLLKCSRFHRRQTKESQRVLNRCACGDVVYCEMPLKDWELSGVREGHRCRPYLVLKVNRRGIIGIPASHKEPDNPNGCDGGHCVPGSMIPLSILVSSGSPRSVPGLTFPDLLLCRQSNFSAGPGRWIRMILPM